VDAVYHADAMIWSTPTYHGSISGSFKNALDWLILLAGRDPPYLTGKPIGLVSTAGGVQGLQAVNSMDFIARALRGWSVPQVLPVAQAWQSFDPEGHLVDEPVSAQLRALGAEVVRAARQFQRDGTCDYAEDRSFMAGERPAPGPSAAGPRSVVAASASSSVAASASSVAAAVRPGVGCRVVRGVHRGRHGGVGRGLRGRLRGRVSGGGGGGVWGGLASGSCRLEHWPGQVILAICSRRLRSWRLAVPGHSTGPSPLAPASPANAAWAESTWPVA
jgi:FMN reductase